MGPVALGSLVARLTHTKTSRELGNYGDSVLNVFSLSNETSKSLFVFL